MREKIRPLGLQVRTGLHTGSVNSTATISAPRSTYARPVSPTLGESDEVLVSSTSGTWCGIRSRVRRSRRPTNLKWRTRRLAAVRRSVGQLLSATLAPHTKRASACVARSFHIAFFLPIAVIAASAFGTFRNCAGGDRRQRMSDHRTEADIGCDVRPAKTDISSLAATSRASPNKA